MAPKAKAIKNVKEEVLSEEDDAPVVPAKKATPAPKGTRPSSR